MSKKWKIAGGGAVVLLLLGVAGSCAADLETELGWPQADPLKSEWVGTIVSTDVIGRLPTDDIDFGNSTRTITLARVQAPSCGGDGDRAVQALRTRLADLLPAGTAVRVARASFGSFNTTTLDSSSGYVFTSAPLAATTTAPPPTTAATAPTSVSSPAPAPSTTTTTSASASASATSTAPAAGGSANEVLLAEGHGSIATPDLDFSIAASKPLNEQIAAATPYIADDTAQFALLVSAGQSAWDSSAGSQAACRIADQPRVDEKLRRDEEERIRREQQAHLDALRAGPDGQIGTSDDETRYYYDADGNLAVRPDYSSPSYSSPSYSGGGGGGGESRFCRKRWWC